MKNWEGTATRRPRWKVFRKLRTNVTKKLRNTGELPEARKNTNKEHRHGYLGEKFS